jgi:putative FmdB family regulatory protein
MPIYEYKCDNGHIFDIMQSMFDDPLTECGECGAPVKKILHPVGISFKGSGFYSTDYNKESPKKEPKEAAASSDSSNGASDSGSAAEKKTEKTANEPAKKAN